MRAIVVREFGGPEVLVPSDVDEPSVLAHTAIVDVALASITFVETQLRAGLPPHPSMLPALPWIPGNGVGGVVTAIGDGVDPSWLGARVISTTGGSGGYAMRAAAAAADLLRVPAALTTADAVALLADGRTAVALARAAAIRPEERVLVLAAAGGVGSLLVQLAARAGAVVAAAAGSTRKLELARELGATLTVDYTEIAWGERLGAVDVVFDGVGGDLGRASFALVRSGGRFLSFGQASGAFTRVSADEADQRGVALLRGTGAAPDELHELSAAALAEAAAGRLRPVIGQITDLDHAADAHAAIEARTTLGKSLLATTH